jgi:hypothetical protein
VGESEDPILRRGRRLDDGLLLDLEKPVEVTGKILWTELELVLPRLCSA